MTIGGLLGRLVGQIAFDYDLIEGRQRGTFALIGTAAVLGEHGSVGGRGGRCGLGPCSGDTACEDMRVKPGIPPWVAKPHTPADVLAVC